jgi:glycosyltransferase involved in cell wall biosynthesis
MRIDLHLHSIESGASTNWWVKGLGLGLETRESYTPPEEAYRKAKAAGMDFATLTDHQTINGAVTLTHHPDFLVGEEVGTVFPEDNSHIDVLVYGLDASHHPEIQARRPNVYALVEYLREAGLVHVLAHPLFEVGAPLTRAGIEKRMVLFPLWEFINGSRPMEQNRLTRRVAEQVDASDLRQLARLHGLPIPAHELIAGTAGSDDHGGVYPGHTWTEVPAVSSVTDLLDAMRYQQVRPGGEHDSVAKMGATGLRIITGAVLHDGQDPASGRLATGIPEDSPIRSLIPSHADVDKLFEYLPLVKHLDASQVRDILADRYKRQLGQAFATKGEGFPLLGVIGKLGSMVDAHLYVAPYVGIHGYFARERNKTKALAAELYPDSSEPIRVGIFVDDLDEIHGVSTMYQEVQKLVPEASGDTITLVSCGSAASGNVVNLRPLAEVPIPLYDNRRLGVPSILDVLDHIAEAEYDVLHVATPGPIGIAAMVAGYTFGIPIVGAYHTEFASYAEVLSGDALVAEIVEVLVREFYERCHTVVVPSRTTGESLTERGYRIRRLEVLKNGVDTRSFSPAMRDEALHDTLGGGRTLLLYVGRVSREKGLAQLAEGYLQLRTRRDDVHLVIVGDGPYREELAALLGDTVTFTGFIRGEELSRIVASCDVFVFPSMTDTLGRAVIEAQAAGLPAVVFGMGGPRECIQPGTTGFVVEPGDDARFLMRVEDLVGNPAMRQAMGEAARAFSGNLSWHQVRNGLLALYREVRAAHAPASAEAILSGNDGPVVHEPAHAH